MKKQILFNRVGGLAALLLVCTSSLLRAQLPPAAQDDIDRGKIAAQQQDYLLAIRYFQDARKLAPVAPQIYGYLGLAESKIPGRELRANTAPANAIRR